MVKLGDRVEVASSKAGRRSGVVTRVSGRLMTIRWESGEESTLSPGPGVLSVVGRGPAKAPGRKTSAGSKAATKPSSPAKSAATSTKTGATRAATPGKPATGKKAAAAPASRAKKASRSPANTSKANKSGGKTGTKSKTR